MDLLVELKSPRKGLINIKNKDKSCFLWCHVRYINPSKEHFDRFIFLNTKNKNKKWFCKSCLQCFSSENVLIKHKENFLSINDKQSVKLEKVKIKVEKYFKQIPFSFKIYADFECSLRGVECDEGSYTKKYQDHIPCSFAYKVVCIDDRFTKPTVVCRSENATDEFIKVILKEYEYFKKVMNKHFNKNSIMSEEEEHLFQESNSFWICENLIDNDEQKVRDHCHKTDKFRSAAHCNCKINFQLTKKVPVIFHILGGYDSHLIFNELDKFDVKINVIPNGLKKCMGFF